MSKHSAIARILKLEKKLKKRNKKIKKLKKRLTCPECGEPRDYGPGEGCQGAHDMRAQLKEANERISELEAEKAMLSPADLALYRKGWVDCEKYYCGTGEDRSVPVDIAPREEGETLTEFLTRLHEAYERTKKNSIQFD